MEETSFQAPAILTGLSYSKDGGVRLAFHTNELNDEDKLVVARFFQKFGYVLFRSNEFTHEDIPAEDAEDKSKTPSKRLRAVLFLNWKQIGTGDFDTYYRQTMDDIIDQWKAKLD